MFVADGVLTYLPEDGVTRTLSRIAERFAGETHAGAAGSWGAFIAFDTYTKAMLQRQHKAAGRRGMAARRAWGCDDPRAFERAGLPLLGTAVTLSLFQAG